MPTRLRRRPIAPLARIVENHMSPVPGGTNAKIKAALETRTLPMSNAANPATLPFRLLTECPRRSAAKADSVMPKHNPMVTTAISQRREFKNPLGRIAKRLIKTAPARGGSQLRVNVPSCIALPNDTSGACIDRDGSFNREAILRRGDKVKTPHRIGNADRCGKRRQHAPKAVSDHFPVCLTYNPSYVVPAAVHTPACDGSVVHMYRFDCLDGNRSRLSFGR